MTSHSSDHPQGMSAALHMSSSPSGPSEGAAREKAYVRLGPYLASRTTLSRRQAERAIQQGRVKINGVTVTEFVIPCVRGLTLDGTLVRDETAEVHLWAYHKPAGELVTRWDPQRRPTVFESIRAHLPQGRLVAVGRLDYASEGLLLVTNTPSVAHLLETSQWPRTYLVWLDRPVSALALETLHQGCTIDGIVYRPCQTRLIHPQEVQRGEKAGWPHVMGGESSAYPEGRRSNPGHARSFRHPAPPLQSSRCVWVTLMEGKKREVRELMRSLGTRVMRLKRLSFGPYVLGDLPCGYLRTLDLGSMEKLGNK